MHVARILNGAFASKCADALLSANASPQRAPPHTRSISLLPPPPRSQRVISFAPRLEKLLATCLVRLCLTDEARAARRAARGRARRRGPPVLGVYGDVDFPIPACLPLPACLPVCLPSCCLPACLPASLWAMGVCGASVSGSWQLPGWSLALRGLCLDPPRHQAAAHQTKQPIHRREVALASPAEWAGDILATIRIRCILAGWNARLSPE